MRISLVLPVVVALAACGAPKKKVALNIGLALPQSGALVTGELYTNSANLAIKHITEAGGMRGNGQLVTVSLDTGATTQGAQDAIIKLVEENQIKTALVVTSSETIGIDPMTKKPFGAGVMATIYNTPLICIGCSAPDFECIGLQQYVFAATATGGDPTCANPTAGTIESPGWVYRMVETSIPQGAALAQMALADGATTVAGLAVNLPFGTALLGHPVAGVKKIVTDATKTYVRTSVHEQSPAALAAKTMVASVTPQEFEAHVKASYDAAIADDATAGAVQAVVINSFPDYNKLIAAAAQANAKKPKLYFSFTGFSSELLATSGNALVGAKGTNYAIAGGPSPGAFVADYAAIGNVPETQVYGSIYVDTAYDAMILSALAIYATGVENPTGEQVKAKLDTLNDPNGEPIGYKEFAKAKKILDSGGAINYQGVSGTLDFSKTNGVKSPIGKWEIVLDGANPAYKTLP